MDTTTLGYIAMCVILGATAIYLIVRDLNSASEQKRLADEAAAGPKLSRLPMAGETLPSSGFSDRLDFRYREMIYQSGLEIPPEAAFLLQVLCGLVIGGGLLLWRDDMLLAVVGFVIGFVAPWAYYNYRRNLRMSQVREQLPGSMDLIARSVRAGETLDQAVEGAGRDTLEPLGVEWRRTARHMEMGLAVPAAMRSMTHRVPLMELRILGTALNVQRRTGGNLPTTLERMSHVIRDRMSYQRQFKAATGASRAATLLIALAGPAVFTYMMIFQPDYMGQFFNLPGGWTLLTIAGVLQMVGLLWVWNLLKTDY